MNKDKGNNDRQQQSFSVGFEIMLVIKEGKALYRRFWVGNVFFLQKDEKGQGKGKLNELQLFCILLAGKEFEIVS